MTIEIALYIILQQPIRAKIFRWFLNFSFKNREATLLLLFRHNDIIYQDLKLKNYNTEMSNFWRSWMTWACLRRCPWCNDYRHRKWTRWHEFKSWTRLIAFHIALISWGTVWILLFSLQLWVKSRADWVLQPWWGN